MRFVGIYDVLPWWVPLAAMMAYALFPRDGARLQLAKVSHGDDEDDGRPVSAGSICLRDCPLQTKVNDKTPRPPRKSAKTTEERSSLQAAAARALPPNAWCLSLAALASWRLHQFAFDVPPCPSGGAR
jgi:hypothetical protein